jgi:hypothetical protein
MSDARHQTAREMLDELNPLIGAIPFYGPPVVAVAGPWLLFALMLAGPFALLLTLVVALIALAGLIGAILGAPYLLVRHLARHSTSRAVVQPRAASSRARSTDSVSAAAY